MKEPAKLCIGREFHVFAKHPSSPVADWLPTLARHAMSDQVGQQVTMALTWEPLWFHDRHLNTVAEGENLLLTMQRAELAGLPFATVITADIEPPHFEGAACAQQLMGGGVKVDYRNHPGVTQECSETDAVTDAARQASLGQPPD